MADRDCEMADSPEPEDERHPIRPVERKPMKKWLRELLEAKTVDTLQWEDRSKGEFRIKWCHGSRHGWSMKEVELFRLYAEHTGRLKGYDPDPKRWKANFRCALNSLKDVQELKGRSQKKGSNAYKYFCFQDAPGPIRVQPTRATGSRPRTRSQAVPKVEDISSEAPSGDEGGSERLTVSPGMEDRGSPAWALSALSPCPVVTSAHCPQVSTYCPPPLQNIPSPSNLPNFGKINPDLIKVEYGKMHTLSRFNSGFTMLRGPAAGDQPSGVKPREPQSREQPAHYTAPETPEASDRDGSCSPDSTAEDEDVILTPSSYYGSATPVDSVSPTSVVQSYRYMSDLMTPLSCRNVGTDYMTVEASKPQASDNSGEYVVEVSSTDHAGRSSLQQRSSFPGMKTDAPQYQDLVCVSSVTLPSNHSADSMDSAGDSECSQL